MADEIELKLELTEAAMRALPKATPILSRGIVFGPARQLVSAYFDTPDQTLRRKGVYLRVRKSGRSYIQTVKTMPEAGLLSVRGEWEWPVPSPAPDLDLALESGLKPLKKRARKGDVVAVFASHIARRTALFVVDDSEIELALDRGEVRAGRRRAAIHEAELELKRGSAAPLFELARQLGRLPGVRVAVKTKAERGFELAEGRPAAPPVMPKLRLDGAMTPAAAAAAILDHCAAQAAANAILLVDRRLPEAVHQLRVALRRMRAALAIFAPELPDDAKRLKRRAAWLADSVGAARDLDVLLNDSLKPVTPPAALADDMAALRRRLAGRRGLAWRRAVEAAGHRRTTLMLLRAAETAAALRARPAQPETPSLKSFAAACLELRWEAVVALGHSIDLLTVEQRHDLRLALKKLRYAADFFRELFPQKKAKAEIKALGGLQDALGAFNDAAVAGAVVRAALEGSPRASRAALDRAALFVDGWAAHRGEAAWANVRDRWAIFATTEPFWRSGL